MAEINNSIFAGLKTPRDLTQYTLLRGVTDFSNLAQFNLFETGYSFLIPVGIPKFLEVLRDQNSEYRQLIDTYKHILQYEFRGIDGFDNITVDTSELTNGISTLNVITKVNMQSASQFSMRFFEKSGSLITRVHELFLRGIKDPRTQVKTYNGLLDTKNTGSAAMSEAGYEHETFRFLYLVTDNTVMNLEKAYYIVCGQPTTAETNIYNSERGEIGFKELTCEFNGYPITGPEITAKGKEFLNWIRANSEFQDANFHYKGIDDIGSPTSGTTTTTR